jgi:hypothetical protein
MPLNYEQIADRTLEDTDGQNNFARLNLSMSDAIASIRPHALAVLSYTLFVKCLSKVPKYADLPGDIDNDPCTGDVDRGRWSFIVNASDLVEETTYNGDESNINKSIKILLTRRMFFKFSVPIAKGSVSIYTYNRYPFLNGLFWKQHEDDWKGDFNPPVVPKLIVSLASDRSYKNALSRLCKPLHNKMRTYYGWSTAIEVENRVKEAFCVSFLENLIAGTCQAVKSHFKSFVESGLTHDEYVSYVWKTAKALPQYQGINMSENFLLDLHLPKKYIDKLKHEISQEKKISRSSDRTDNNPRFCSPKNNNKKSPSEVQNTSKEPEITEVQNTSQSDIMEVQNTSQSDIMEVQNTSQSGKKIGLKDANINDLQEKNAFYQRTIHNRKNKTKDIEDIKGEKINDMIQTENEVSVKVFSSTELDGKEESSYNASMNDNQSTDKPDQALTEEECNRYAFSNRSFLPHGKNTQISQCKVLKTVDPDADEKAIMKKLANSGKALVKKSEKSETATILNNANKFVRMFRQIVKEIIPGVFYPESQEQTRNDCYMSQMAIDKLREREALDEGVLTSWMRFTANACLKRKYFKGVSEMLHTLNAFEPNIPTPESMARRKQTKKVSIDKNKDVIVTSMGNLFSENLKPSRVALSCQLWGIPITAQYLSSRVDVQKAKMMIKETLAKSSMSDIKGMMSMSQKYDPITSNMVLANWRGAFASTVTKAGQLDNFELTDLDKAAVEEFVLAIIVNNKFN